MNRSGQQGETPSARRPSRGRRLVRLAAGVALALFLIFAYLGWIGLPGTLFGRWIRELERQGLYVGLERVRLDLARGIVLDGLRLYDTADRAAAVVEAEKVKLGFNPLDWLDRRKAGLRGAQVRGGTLRLRAAGAPEPLPDLVMDGLHARIDVEPEGLRLSGLSMRLLGTRVRGEGFVAMNLKPAAGPRPPSDFPRKLAELLRKVPPWVPRALEEAKAIRYAEPPSASLRFQVVAANLNVSEARLEVRTGETEVRRVRLDGWSLDARLAGGKLSLASFSVRRGEERCDVSGSLDLADNMAEFRAFNTLPPSAWMNLVPAAWRDLMEKENCEFQGPGSFEVWAGPAPLRGMGGRVAGWCSLEKAKLRGVWLEKAFVAVKKEGEQVTLDRMEALVGRGKQMGLLRGTASYRLDTRDYAASGETGFDPNALLPILNRNQARTIRSIVFAEGPPRTQIEVSGQVGRPQLIRMKGHLWGTNFTYNGASVRTFDSGLSVSNGIMTLFPMLVERDEGRGEGLVAVDFDNQMVEINATNTADPYAVAKYIGPAVGKFVESFRFEGPVRVAAKGIVDYGAHRKTDLEGTVEGERMGMDWALADRAAFRVRARGARLEFTDVRASAWDGTFEGNAVFDRINEPSNIAYIVSGTAQDVDFRQLAQSLGAKESKPYEGRLSGAANVSGILGKGRGDTAVGEGRLVVREGHLFEIPLLGGLSKYVSRIYPKLGFLTQTDFKSSFKIGGREVRSEDAYLEGSIVSVSGRGTYAFDHGLDIDVQVQLLRQGPLASVLRLVTFPVTKLLEFHLGGTLENPKWRPINFPKELFLIFD